MNSSKIGTIFFVSVLALAGVGISFAGLTDNIHVYGTVSTATVDLEVHNYSGTWVWKIWGCLDAPDDEIYIYTGYEENIPDVATMFPGCNIELVSWAKGRNAMASDPINPDTGLAYDAIVEFHNLFPCIDFHADIVFHYNGTIPAKIINVDMGWTGEDTELPDGTTGDWLAYLKDTGGLTYHLGQSPIPTQIHYCDYLYFYTNIHLPQNNLFQGLSGTGYLTIEVQQWNDECDGTIEDKIVNLPTFPVNMVVATPWFLPPSLFKTTISGTGYPGPNAEYNVWDGDWVGWCCDEDNLINPGTQYQVTLYSSYDPTMPIYFQDPDWPKVNWIINHKSDYEPYTYTQMQEAFWHYVNGGYSGSDPKILQIIADADANGVGFIPQEGEWLAVLCDAGPDMQHSFIEVDP